MAIQSLQNVQSIVPPKYDDFIEKYLFQQEVVVIKNLLSDSRLHEIDTLEKLRNKLGSCPIQMNREYLSEVESFGSFGGSGETKEWNLSDWIDSIQSNQEQIWGARENILFPELAKFIQIPEYCGYGLQSGKKIVSKFFLNSKKQTAPLHFDWDMREVLLHQVIGRKRVIVISPDMGKFLGPMLNFCSVDIAAMDDEDRSGFLRLVKAKEFILEPGETIYIPKAYWHFVEYVDHGFSINFRFAHTQKSELIAKAFQGEYYAQFIGALMCKNPANEDKYHSYFEKIAAAYSAPSISSIEKYYRMSGLAREICNDISPDSLLKNYIVPNKTVIQNQIDACIRRGAFKKLQPEKITI